MKTIIFTLAISLTSSFAIAQAKTAAEINKQTEMMKRAYAKGLVDGKELGQEDKTVIIGSNVCIVEFTHKATNTVEAYNLVGILRFYPSKLQGQKGTLIKTATKEEVLVKEPYKEVMRRIQECSKSYSHTNGSLKAEQ